MGGHDGERHVLETEKERIGIAEKTAPHEEIGLHPVFYWTFIGLYKL